MNYVELLAFLDANWPKTTLRAPVQGHPFDRLCALLERLGHPELSGEFVGVTGSKGKGSIAALTAAILQQHGLRLGLFTSPHLVRVEERVQVDESPLAPQHFARRFGEVLAEQQRAGLEDLGITPTMLAVALIEFRATGVDVGVLEVRAGGRFDPTAVVPAQTVGIGPIGLEHVPGLGYTLAEIAWQKVGLVKPGAECFSSAQPPDAAAVIAHECARVGARLFRESRDVGCAVTDLDENGQVVKLRTPRASVAGLRLSLLGEHQAANAALAASLAEAVLRRRGRELESGALATALCSIRIPARLERLRPDPLVLYDGAHTPDSTRALARALGDHFPERRWSVVLGILNGKDARGILNALRPVAARLRCVPVFGFSHQSPDTLARQARSLGYEARSCPNLVAALHELADCPDPICVSGTLYLYGATLEALGQADHAIEGLPDRP